MIQYFTNCCHFLHSSRLFIIQTIRVSCSVFLCIQFHSITIWQYSTMIHTLFAIDSNAWLCLVSSSCFSSSSIWKSLQDFNVIIVVVQIARGPGKDLYINWPNGPNFPDSSTEIRLQLLDVFLMVTHFQFSGSIACFFVCLLSSYHDKTSNIDINPR